MVSSLARTMGTIVALVALAAVATAGDPADSIRPGNPVILFPGNGSMVVAERPVEVTWEMPGIFALPAGYEVEIKKAAGDTWVRRAGGRTSGRAQGTVGIRLEPGTYLVYLTAVNPAGTAQAAPHIFRVLTQAQYDAAISQVTTRSETNPDGTPKAPGTTGGGVVGGGGRRGGGLKGALGGVVKDGPATAKQPNNGGDAAAPKSDPAGSSASASKSEKPAAPKNDKPETAAAPKPEPKPSAPDPEVEDVGSAAGGHEGTVKPTGAGAGVAPAPAPVEADPEEHRSIRGRLVVLTKGEKLDFAKTIARVDAAVDRLKAEDARAEAGEEESTHERVGGDLEVWVVEIPKAPKKKGAAMQPLRRYRVTFEDPTELSRLRDKLGHKIAIEGSFKYSATPPATGEAGDLSLAKIVFMAPAR